MKCLKLKLQSTNTTRDIKSLVLFILRQEELKLDYAVALKTEFYDIVVLKGPVQVEVEDQENCMTILTKKQCYQLEHLECFLIEKQYF